jgi:hypothetical protein
MVAKHCVYRDFAKPIARVHEPGMRRGRLERVTHLLWRERLVHYPGLPPDCAATARNRYLISGCLQAGHRTPLWPTGITRPTICHPGHCARQNPPQSYLPQICSRGRSAGSHRSHKRGCQSEDAGFQVCSLMLNRKVRNAALRVQLKLQAPQPLQFYPQVFAIAPAIP